MKGERFTHKPTVPPFPEDKQSVLFEMSRPNQFFAEPTLIPKEFYMAWNALANLLVEFFL